VSDGEEEEGSSVAVFAPVTTLSVTLECNADTDELHVHPAGQGYWVSRMLRVLGSTPLLCTPLGGETGTVLRTLLAELDDAAFIETDAPNGSYIHDRREGDRVVIAEVGTPPLSRHALDDLVSVTLASALRAGTVVACGTNLLANVAPDVYGRLCADIRSGGATVVADLSGDELRAALTGGIDILKLSHTELIDGGWATDDATGALVTGMRALHAAGARTVVVSRANEGALASDGHRVMTFRAPELTVVDHRGAGDSMTAALAHCCANEIPFEDSLRLAAGAAALNVTRHGLSSGRTEAIEVLAERVEVEEISA
jgi:1-phosphofructokinase